ncbi:unnamed protein product [Closterium sp. NIES-54]
MASWGPGRRPKRLHGILGAWTLIWASGRRPVSLDTELGFCMASWAPRRRPRHPDVDLGAGTPLLGMPVWCSRRLSELGDRAWLSGRPSYPCDVCDGYRSGFYEADLGSGIQRSTWLASSYAIVTMVCVGNSGVVDILEARLEDARKRHLDGEYGQTLPLVVVEAGIRTVWAEEHPPRPSSSRPVNTKGGVNVGVNAVPSYGYFKFTPDRISVTPLLVGRPDILTWKEAIEHQLEMARLKYFADGTVETSLESNTNLRAEFRVVQLLTFTIISWCCSSGVQITLKTCRDYLDTGHQAWNFIESTYQVTDDLYIGQLEEQMTHLRMGGQETVTDYCNRARRLLATMRMAGVQYSTASYVTHVLKGLRRSYNLMKRMSVVLSTRAMLNEDSLTSYILRDEAMQEVEQSTELLPQVNYAAPMKQGSWQGQRSRPGGGGSGGGRPAKDADKGKSAKDSGCGGGSRRRECWLCGDPDHLSFECPDRDDSEDDDTKGGGGRSAGRLPCWESKPCKEKQSTKSSTSAKDNDSSSDDKG